MINKDKYEVILDTDKYEIKHKISISKSFWSNYWYSNFLNNLNKRDIKYKKEESEIENKKTYTFFFYILNKEEEIKFLDVYNKYKFWLMSWRLL